MTWPLLTAAYVAIALLLLNLNINAPVSLRLRILAVVAVSLLYAGTWMGLGALRGSPSDAPLPEAFRLNWVQVEEANKESGEAGAIYYWVRPLDAGGLPEREPRSFVVPFDDEAADAAREAQEALMGGQHLNGYLTRGTIDPETGQPVPQDAGGGSGAGAHDEDRPRFEFREAGRPELPPKSLPPG